MVAISGQSLRLCMAYAQQILKRQERDRQAGERSTDFIEGRCHWRNQFQVKPTVSVSRHH